MTNIQLYLTVGLPTFAVLIGVLINGMQFSSLNARLSSVETRLDMAISKLMDIESRLSRLEARFEDRRH